MPAVKPGAQVVLAWSREGAAGQLLGIQAMRADLRDHSKIAPESGSKNAQYKDILGQDHQEPWWQNYKHKVGLNWAVLGTCWAQLFAS